MKQDLMKWNAEKVLDCLFSFISEWMNVPMPGGGWLNNKRQIIMPSRVHWKNWLIIKIFRQGLSALDCKKTKSKKQRVCGILFLAIYGKCTLQIKINLCNIFTTSETCNFSASQIRMSRNLS